MEKTSALATALRRWWIIAIFAVVGALLAALPAPETPEERDSLYVATHTMLLNDPQVAQTGSAPVAPTQIPFFASTGEVPERVVEQLGLEANPPTVASQMEVEFDFSTGALTFTTRQADPELAVALADAFADNTSTYLAERQDAVYQERLAASLERVTTLEAELDQITRELTLQPENPALLAQRDAVARQYSVAFEQNRSVGETSATLAFTSLERAQAVLIQESGIAAPQSRTARGLFGFIAGLALGVVVAMMLGRVDRRIRTVEQAEAALGTRARVLIPKTRDRQRDRLVVHLGRHDQLSDAYRTVRNVVGFVHSTLEPVERARVTVVVSPGPGDGKTSLATNLAGAFVESGQRIIAVNSDFRRPRLQSAIDDSKSVDHPFTLEDLEVLAPKSLLDRTETPGLLVMDLSSIDGTAGELARATASMIPGLTEISDAVVIDTSPVSATAEVLDLVPYADVLVMLIRLGHTSIPAARRAIAVLRDVSNAPILLVVNSAKQERTTYYGYSDQRGVGNVRRWGSRFRPGRSSSRPRRAPSSDLEPVG